MQQEKRKRNQKQRNTPKDHFDEADRYNKEYHALDKIDNKLGETLLNITMKLGVHKTRVVKAGELTGFIALLNLQIWSVKKRAEIRCYIDELLIEETWDMLRGLSKRIRTKADIEKLAAMEQRLMKMRSEDANLNEKFDRIEPVLESFELFLKEKGLNLEDLMRDK